MSQGDLVAAMLELPEQSESMEVEEHHEGDIVQGTIDYIMMSTTKHTSQCYADMIRVTNDSIIRSLENGVLVKSITIYALLVSHDNLDECVPMKYYCNFNECKQCC